jgi:hypothetical protein
MAMPKVLVLFLLGIFSARYCLAQPVPFGDIQEEEGVPNYAYSVFAGTGVYKIDDRRIYILRVPMKFDLKKIDYEAGEKYGLRLLLPVSVGITDFEDAEGLPDFGVDDLHTFSTAPGLEVPIALSSRWQIKPFAQLGYGVDLKSDSKSVIWGTGLRSSIRLGETSRWIIGGEFLWAGNNPNGDEPTTSFSRLGAGAEYRIPTDWEMAGRRVSWNLRLIQWYYSNAVNFKPPRERYELTEVTEVGVSLSVDKPIKILGYGFSQAGIGYEKTSGFDAIVFYTTFPF